MKELEEGTGLQLDFAKIAKVAANLAKQTGLRFVVERRKVPVWFVKEGPPDAAPKRVGKNAPAPKVHLHTPQVVDDDPPADNLRVTVSVASGVVGYNFGGKTGQLAAGESRTFTRD